MSKIDVLDKGHLTLVDVMGSDKTVVNAARVSYASADWLTKELSERDEKLIRYLAEHKHVSPFYHPNVSFVIKAPISVQRQAVTHRIGTAINSESTRYTEMAEEFYMPSVLRGQSKSNKQGSEGLVFGTETLSTYRTSCELAFRSYRKLLSEGVAREQAREVLPLCTYTSWFWTMSLAACVHFIKLRDEDHAQEEIRCFAKAMRQLVTPLFPISMSTLLKETSS
jgi:thymidylate synthase (FAD)